MNIEEGKLYKVNHILGVRFYLNRHANYDYGSSSYLLPINFPVYVLESIKIEESKYTFEAFDLKVLIESGIYYREIPIECDWLTPID